MSNFFPQFPAASGTQTAGRRRGPRNRPPAPAVGKDVEATYILKTAVARRFERAAARPRPTRAHRVPRSSLLPVHTNTIGAKQPSRCVTTRPPAPRTPPGRTDGTTPAPSPRRRPRRDRRATAPAAPTRRVNPQLFCYSSCCYRRRRPSTGPPRPPHPPTRTEPRHHLPPSSCRRRRRERRTAAPQPPRPRRETNLTAPVVLSALLVVAGRCARRGRSPRPPARTEPH